MRTFEVPTFYRSPLISAIKQKRKAGDKLKKDFTPTCLDMGPLQIYLARHFGFCYGVENAIEMGRKVIVFTTNIPIAVQGRAVPCRAVWYFNRMKIIIIKTNTLLQTKNSDALQHLKDNLLSANDIISNYFLTVKFYLQLNCYIFSNSFNY